MLPAEALAFDASTSSRCEATVISTALKRASRSPHESARRIDVATCRSCKATIEWAVTEAGKRIPIDTKDL
jgi:hypothetical protein